MDTSPWGRRARGRERPRGGGGCAPARTSREGRPIHPVGLEQAEGVARGLVGGAHDDAAGLGLDALDVAGLPSPEVESAALAHGEAVDAGMGAEHLALGVDDLARRAGGRRPSPRSRRSPHRARSRSPCSPACGWWGGHGARRRRGPRPWSCSPTGKRTSASSSWPEGEEEVALVLGGVDGAAQDEAAVLLLDAGVVAGGQPGAEGAGALEQEVELHVAVAGHAGDGRAARRGRTGRRG